MKPDSAVLPGPAKYFFMRAVRPFSLSVAVVTCGLGIVLAWGHGLGDGFRALLVMFAGVLLQSAVNLFNDYADLSLWTGRNDAYGKNIIRLIRRNVRVAKVMAVVALLMGLILVFHAGWQLLVLGIAGVAGGYFYTGYPVSYKNRGLGVVGVFLFAGVLMVSGSYLAVAGQWSSQVMIYSIPVSLISSMLLLANELRDFDEDCANRIRTFTVRCGFGVAAGVYLLLGAAALLFSWGLGFSGALSSPWLMVLPLLALKAPYGLLRTAHHFEKQRKQLVRLPPLTGRFFLIFGLCMMMAV